MENPQPNLGYKMKDGLIFLGEHLVVPRIDNLRETFFRLAHDNLGHFGTLKSYHALKDAYYWPHMKQDLEQSYIPGCEDCQRNKPSTKPPTGPLHPLPIANAQFDCVFIDFVGPLPEDKGFNYLCTMTDQLVADVKLIPCRSEITAEDFAKIFFDHWYCDNSLPLKIVSDRDRLFTSKFWHALHKISGMKLKLSSAFHPQTDGLSERTNKTVIQALRYNVERTQTGWVDALPRVCFSIMNMVNASTGYSGFQLRTGRSPRLLPPLLTVSETTPEATLAQSLLEHLERDCNDVRDALIYAKVNQAHFANKKRRTDEEYKVGDFVMLSTLHCCRDYMQVGDGRMAKFMP